MIRTQVYVPQDQAFGVAPGVEAVVRVPELPDRGFPGKVTRIADALEPGTRTLLTEIDVPNPEGALPRAYIARSSCISRARGRRWPGPRPTPSSSTRDGLRVAVDRERHGASPQGHDRARFRHEVEVSDGAAGLAIR